MSGWPRMIAAAAAVVFPVVANAQGMDRATLAGIKYRDCQNAVLASPNNAAAIPLFGLSIDDFCRCQANMLVSRSLITN